MILTPKELAETVTDYLNPFAAENKPFINAMDMQHRTLQQKFTVLCLEWLEHCASPEYRTDLRNEDSHTVSLDLITAFKKHKEADFKPSEYLRHI